MNNDPEKPKKKGSGRKTNFIVTEEVIAEVELLSSQGLNQTNIHNYFSVSKNAWQRKMSRVPELKNAYDRGKAVGISFVSSKLMERIKEGNLEAIKFYLARVGKFSEAPLSESTEFEESQPQKLVISVTDPIEAAKIYQQFMSGSAKK